MKTTVIFERDDGSKVVYWSHGPVDVETQSDVEQIYGDSGFATSARHNQRLAFTLYGPVDGKAYPAK